MLAVLIAIAPAASAAPPKPRMVVLTDVSTWETDDSESLVRLLAHADLLEIEGLVFTTGWSLDKTRDDFIDLIHDAINAYEKDLPNLQKRSEQSAHWENESRQEIGYWPSANYLRACTMFGSKNRGAEHVGEGNDSPGSKRIIQLADEDDDRPLWITVWGGGNTLAQAVWRVKHDRSEEELKTFLHKLRVYTITDQDREQRTPFSDSSHQWLRKEFEKDLFFIWDECAWKYQNGTGKKNWPEYETQIQNHGNLGKVYPKYKYGVEGDTPAFLHLMPIGLNNPNVPTQGGWGGYFEWGLGEDGETSCYTNHSGAAKATCNALEDHFYSATFNNFAARMDWANQGTGNRNPVVAIGDDKSLENLAMNPQPGTSLTLDASNSVDPDGDGLKFNWWVLSGAGTYPSDIKIANSDSAVASIEIPSDSAGKSIHVICEVTDDGAPNLTGYRRIIIEPAKTRVCVLTDIENEPDDAQSLVRFLTYANHFDVEGLVATTSIHQPNKTAPDRIRQIVKAYGEVQSNLLLHEPGYPTAEYLLSVVREGRPDYGMNAVGEGQDSAGSELLIAAVDRDDPRPLWVPVWGGPNVLAQALWKVRATRSPEALAKFVAKLRVYTISDQDNSGPWIRKTFPELFYIASPGIHAGGAYHYATWSGISGDKFHARFTGADFSIVDNDWLDHNIRQGHGPLGAEHPHTEYLMEGDTPSFLGLVHNGLNTPEHPNWGGWGGRYEFYTPRMQKWFQEPETRPLWTNAVDEVKGFDGNWHTSNHATIWRWRSAYQNDFAARIDWTTRSYDQANHPPVVKLAHPAELTAKRGALVELSAAGTTDPDGDALSYEWFYYGEIGTFTTSSGRTGQPLEIKNFDQQQASFSVPDGRVMQPGTGTMHIILAVTDNGTPMLTRYRRVVVNVTE